MVHVVQVWCLAQLKCGRWDVYVFGSGRRGWRGGEWMRGSGLDFTNSVGTGGVLDQGLEESGGVMSV